MLRLSWQATCLPCSQQACNPTRKAQAVIFETAKKAANAKSIAPTTGQAIDMAQSRKQPEAIQQASP